MQVIWDIMRCWVKQHPVKIAADDTSYRARILAQEPAMQADFSGSGHMSKSKSSGKARFVQNPENWGPRPKHGRPLLPHEVEAAAAAAAATKASQAADAAHTPGMARGGMTDDAGAAAKSCSGAEASACVTGSGRAANGAALPTQDGVQPADGAQADEGAPCAVTHDAKAAAAAAWDAPASAVRTRIDRDGSVHEQAVDKKQRTDAT